MFDELKRPEEDKGGGKEAEEVREVAKAARRAKSETAAEGAQRLSAWTDGLLAEFNSIIAQELTQLLEQRGREGLGLVSPIPPPPPVETLRYLEDAEDSGLERSAEILDSPDPHQVLL